MVYDRLTLTLGCAFRPPSLAVTDAFGATDGCCCCGCCCNSCCASCCCRTGWLSRDPGPDGPSILRPSTAARVAACCPPIGGGAAGPAALSMRCLHSEWLSVSMRNQPRPYQVGHDGVLKVSERSSLRAKGKSRHERHLGYKTNHRPTFTTAFICMVMVCAFSGACSDQDRNREPFSAPRPVI